VTFRTDFIPNIYASATVSFVDDLAELTFSGPIDAVMNDTIKYSVIRGDDSKEYTDRVIFVSADRCSIRIPKWAECNISDHVTVYGKEVNDFHHLDKTAIAMLGLGCLKEVYNTAKAQNIRLDSIQDRMDTLESTIAAMMIEVQGMIA
jgi:hypothetical protein